MRNRRKRSSRRLNKLPAITLITEMCEYGPARWDNPRRAGSPVPGAQARYPALSVGPGFDATRFEGTVHSVFARALNIQLDGSRLAALVAPDLPNAPATIRVDLGGAPFHAIAAPGQTAACRAGILRLGHAGNIIDLRQAEAWHPKPPPSSVPGKEAWQSLYAIALSSPRLGVLTEWPGLKICAKAGAFAGLSAAELIPVLASLVGRGPGLTPAGDDFIAGLAAALHWSAQASALARHIPGWALRTTDVSRWLLLDSNSGQIAEPVCDLGAALYGQVDQLPLAADAVMKLGHLSGLAMILGMLAGYAFAWTGLAAPNDIGLAA